MSYLTLDLETSTKELHKRKASPFHPENRVVLAGWRMQGAGVESARLAPEATHEWAIPLLMQSRLLLGFNLKFDVLHLMQCPKFRAAWMQWVAGGGQVFDAQLAEYLLNGMHQSEHYLSLDEVAPRYGGNVKVDEVKALWAAGVATEDIDPDLLNRYLVGGEDENGQWQEGDIGNTELVALAQIKRARECGQLNSLMLNMGALLFTIEAEFNGMYVDRERGAELTAELEAEVAELQAGLAQYIPDDLPFEFKWSSRYHKSALIFGGTVQYESYEWQLADGSYMQEAEWEAAGRPTRAYAQRPTMHYILADGRTMECLWWEHCYATEHGFADDENNDRQTFKAGKRAGEFKTKQVQVNDLSKPKGRKCKAPYTFPQMTAPSKEWETSEPGVYSVGSEVIEALGNRNIPFLKALARLTEATKDLGTYFIVTDADTGESKGMLSLVGVDGIIHHMLNMSATVTARLSSSNPNLQNLPREGNSKVKLLFVSRFGEGGVIISSDFSALEVYVQAILTGSVQLIEDLRNGLDMHCVRVSQVEHVSYEEALLRCKGDKARGIPAEPEWDKKRTAAKVFSFRRAYGAGNATIAEGTGLPLEEVEALAAAEDARYPEINEYVERVTHEIRSSRKPLGRVVPHPTVPGMICHLGRGFYRTPDGKLYSYDEAPAPEFQAKRGTTAGFSPTIIKNYAVQGTGGEFMKAAMWLLVREFYRRGNFGGRGLLVNTVHDAAYADAAPEVKAEVAAVVHACMSAASEYMEYLFKWPVPVAVPTETSWGANMMEENAIPAEAMTDAASLRLELRARYMRGIIPTFETE